MAVEEGTVAALSGMACRELEREVWEIASRVEWLERRRHDLTASRMPALFEGVHPYLTLDQLAAIMRGESETGSSSIPDNPAMRRGRIFEAAVASAIAEERPHWTVTKATTYHRIPSLRIGCTPDLFVLDGDQQGLIQIKTVAPQQWDRWHAQPPLCYLIQTLTELIVTDRSFGWLVIMVMSPSYPTHYFAVPRHAEAEERILRAAASWWAEWDSGALAAPAEAAGLAAIFDDGSNIDLSTDNELPSLLDERETLRQSVGIEEKRIGEIDAALKAKIGAAKTAWLPGWQLTYGTHHRDERLVPASDYRMLRVRRIREEV